MRILQLIKNKIESAFLKNVFVLLSGSAIAQIIGFLVLPILTRLFSEELFGVFMLYTSTVLLLKPLTTLSYQIALLLPEKDEDAVNILVFNFLIITVISFFFLLVLIFVKDQIISALNLKNVGDYIYMIPLSVFLVASIDVLEHWSNRNNKFKLISVGVVTKSSVMSVTQLGVGYSSFKKIGLIPGLVVGQLCAFLSLVYFSSRSIFQLKSSISISKMVCMVKKYKDIPLFTTMVSFTNNLSNELPVILFTRFYGLDIAGVYGLSVKLSKGPVGLIQNSISNVFLNKISKAYHNKENLYEIVKRTYKNLFGTGLVIFIVLFMSSFLLGFVFGTEWGEAGVYMRIMIPWLFIGFLNSPISSLITVLNKQKALVFYDICLLSCRFLAIYISYRVSEDVLFSLMSFTAVGFVFNLLIMIYFLRISREEHIDRKKVYSKN